MPVAIEGFILDHESPIFGNVSCHVVTHVFLPEQNKWVMLDPSFNTYVMDKDFRPLNIVEITTALRNGTQLFTCDISDESWWRFKGLACLICSLPSVQIWRGNDYAHRVGAFTWDTAYQLASENTARQVQYLLDNNLFTDWRHDKLIAWTNSTKIAVSDLLAPPYSKTT